MEKVELEEVQEIEAGEHVPEAVEHTVEHTPDISRQKSEAEVAADTPDPMRQWDWAVPEQEWER